jgi:hypothetical protein
MQTHLSSFRADAGHAGIPRFLQKNSKERSAVAYAALVFFANPYQISIASGFERPAVARVWVKLVGGGRCEDKSRLVEAAPFDRMVSASVDTG